MSRPCLSTHHVKPSFFNDLVKSLDLKWGRSDADFHHIFLKERPHAPSLVLAQPKEIKRKQMVSPLVPFRCLMLGSHCYIIIARQISKPASQIQTHPTDGPRLVFQVSNTAGSGFVSWITVLSPEKKTAKSEGDHSGKSSFTWISSGNCPMRTIVM